MVCQNLSIFELSKRKCTYYSQLVIHRKITIINVSVIRQEFLPLLLMGLLRFVQLGLTLVERSVLMRMCATSNRSKNSSIELTIIREVKKLFLLSIKIIKKYYIVFSKEKSLSCLLLKNSLFNSELKKNWKKIVQRKKKINFYFISNHHRQLIYTLNIGWFRNTGNTKFPLSVLFRRLYFVKYQFICITFICCNYLTPSWNSTKPAPTQGLCWVNSGRFKRSNSGGSVVSRVNSIDSTNPSWMNRSRPWTLWRYPHYDPLGRSLNEILLMRMQQ